MGTVTFAREVMKTSSRQAKKGKLQNACATTSELEQSWGGGDGESGTAPSNQPPC